MGQHFVQWNGGAWMVKEGEFFHSQPDGDWKKAWHPIEADSIEHARSQAASTWGKNGERWARGVGPKAPETYGNGPKGMPRVQRMPDAVLDCLIRGSPYRYCDIDAQRWMLYSLMHSVAEEVLARVAAWPAPTQSQEAAPQQAQQNIDQVREQFWDWEEGRDFGSTDPVVMALCQKAAWEAWRDRQPVQPQQAPAVQGQQRHSDQWARDLVATWPIAPSPAVPPSDAPSQEADKRDAERYRWLRNKAHYSSYPYDEAWVTSHLGAQLSEVHLDAAIDAAISAHQAGDKQ